MAYITDATDDWSAAQTLSANEIWQAREGSIFLTTSAAPQPNDGLLLTEGTALHLSAGLQVRYRRKGRSATVIVREAV